MADLACMEPTALKGIKRIKADSLLFLLAV